MYIENQYLLFFCAINVDRMIDQYIDMNILKKQAWKEFVYAHYLIRRYYTSL